MIDAGLATTFRRETRRTSAAKRRSKGAVSEGAVIVSDEQSTLLYGK